MLGQTFETRNYGACTVVGYESAREVYVRFETTGFETRTEAGQLRKGQVKDLMLPTIFGKGFVGVGDHRTGGKLYDLWYRMFERCYGDLAINKTYKGCVVVKRWHNYQQFCEDIMTMPNWNTSGFDLDKDLRVKGCIFYYPKTCSFVPHAINSLLNSSAAVRSKTAQGVYKDERKSLRPYVVYMHIDGRPVFQGAFDTKLEASKCYAKVKAARCKQLAEENKHVLHPQVYKTLINYTVRP